MPVLPGLPSGMIPPQMPGVPPTGRPAPPPSDDDAETPEGEIGPAVEESEILEPGVQPPAAAGPGDVESGGGAGPAPATSDVGRGVTPASVSAAPVLPSVGPTRGEETTGQAAPVASAGGAGGMMPAGAAGAGGSGRSGGVAPANRAPLAPHPTQRPAAPRATASNAPRGPVDPPDRPAATVEPPLVAAIPVSVARAERDAIAAANAARRSDAPDALRTARLVAAALNAPGALGATDFGFFWVTGVTTDDDVVVANSYGIGYVPQGVELPEPVVLVSADDAIPIAKRAAWATYPFVAVQEWAAHHGKTLRAIIATEAQFAGVDPGAAKVVLAPDDIPDDGAMGGRSRLLVTDPAAAQKLAATSDGELNRLLPQTATSAVPPADRRMDLWFEVMKPLTSSAEGRETAHLKAFRTYVENAYDVALDAAHAATEPTAKRRATADVMYWGYVCDLLDDALAPASSPH